MTAILWNHLSCSSCMVRISSNEPKMKVILTRAPVQSSLGPALSHSVSHSRHHVWTILIHSSSDVRSLVLLFPIILILGRRCQGYIIYVGLGCIVSTAVSQCEQTTQCEFPYSAHVFGRCTAFPSIRALGPSKKYPNSPLPRFSSLVFCRRRLHFSIAAIAVP